MSVRKRLQLSDYFTTLESGIAAGACIAIGGIACLSVENRIFGAFLFTVGLFTICTFRLNLFTGKVSHVGCQDGMSLLSIVLVWVGNLIGTLAVAGIIQHTRIGAEIIQRADAICQVKLADNLFSLLFLAMFCNAMIYMAVELFNGLENPVGGYLAVLFGVMVFVLCGFEHSVADMFYMAVSGHLLERQAWVCIGIVTIGNAVGGILCHGVRRFLFEH